MAFLLALLGTRRSPGWGLAAVVGVGYFSGAVRANYPSMGTTFMFDFAVLGVYAGTFLTPGAWPAAWASPPGAWVKWLVVWPALLTLVPVHDPFIQLVGLRASVWYVPVLLIAYRLGDDDLTALARALAGLNLIALAVGVYLYQNGIEALYPRNAITELMYRSGDVAGGQYRIPSTFLNAHGYGGTMLLTAPFLIDRLARRGVGGVERVALAVGLAAAVGGILLCAARTPFLIATAATALAWPLAGMSVRVGAGVGVLVAGVLVAAGNDERLSRGLSALDDTDTISERAKGGANEQFLELLGDYPLGAGMGSGAAVPYFLADRAPPPIAMENEYSRILVDQGVVGLGLWLAFLGWVFAARLRAGDPGRAGTAAAYAVSLVSWAVAFTGTGLLAGIPGTVLLLAGMGVVVRRTRG